MNKVKRTQIILILQWKHRHLVNILPLNKHTQPFRLLFCIAKNTITEEKVFEHLLYCLVLLPPSALHRLADYHFESNSPLLFRLSCSARDGLATYTTHCGVLEFIADEGRIYIPEWMMKKLNCKGGRSIHVELCSLPKGKLIKIQPQSVDFLDILDPRGALERALTMFSTLTKGDVIAIQVGEKVFEIEILEVSPEEDQNGGICIHETDLNVDFAPPVGYVEPERLPLSVKNMEGFVENLVAEKQKKKDAFFGKKEEKSQPVGIKMPKGKLFIPSKSRTVGVENIKEEKSPFQGSCKSLK